MMVIKLIQSKNDDTEKRGDMRLIKSMISLQEEKNKNGSS